MAERKNNNPSKNPEMSPLWEAIFQLDAGKVLSLCSKGADINETIDHGPFRKITPLMVAAEHFDLASLKKMIELGADVNARTEGDDVTIPLKAAIMGNSLKKVQCLVDSGAEANPFSSGETDFSPLALAAVRGDVETFDYLLAKGADPQWRNSKNATILKITANAEGTESQNKIVNKLIELGVNPNEPDCEGFFPLHNAAATGNLDVIKALIDAGASPDQPIVGDGDDAGHVPLRKAAARGRRDAFDLLLSKGADIAQLIPENQRFESIDADDEELDLLSAVLLHGFKETGGEFIDSGREEVLSILCNAGARPTMITLAYALLFEGEPDCKKLLFETAKNDLEKYLTQDNSAAFLTLINVLAEQNDSEYRILEIYQELCEILEGMDICSEFTSELRSIADELKVKFDDNDEYGNDDNFSEYFDSDEKVYKLHYKLPGMEYFNETMSSPIDALQYEKLREIAVDYFNSGKFLGSFPEAYPYIDCIDFQGPNGETYDDFEDLMNADADVLPDGLKGSWTVSTEDDEIILSWDVPEWFRIDFGWEGERLFCQDDLISTLSGHLRR